MLNDEGLDTLFLKARTHNGWLDRAVSDEQLRRIHDLMKWGPTSANCCPIRILFVRSLKEKERLSACMSEGNRQKTKAAPVTAILGMDMDFYEKLPELSPAVDARSWFAGKPDVIAATAFRNSSLQGGYFIMAARAIGLDCGPMSGFDEPRLNAEFFAGTSIRVNFVCSIGHGDVSRVRPRAPRLEFEEVCKII
ncbi:malonic semialdehyde reductase [soil metagenome]